MYILSQGEQLENSKDKNYLVRNRDLEKHYQEAGYQKRERVYKIKTQHKEYTVLCPEFWNDKDSSVPVVIIPEFIIPRRPYPVYVYLYGIDLYSNNPDMGQREAAETTRKRFGLSSFAHTTLGRALKAFVCNTEKAESSGECHNAAPGDTGKKGKNQDASSASSNEQDGSEVNQSGFPTTQTTASWRKRAERILGSNINQAVTQQIIESYLTLVRGWFNHYSRLLL